MGLNNRKQIGLFFFLLAFLFILFIIIHKYSTIYKIKEGYQEDPGYSISSDWINPEIARSIYYNWQMGLNSRDNISASPFKYFMRGNGSLPSSILAEIKNLMNFISRQKEMTKEEDVDKWLYVQSKDKIPKVYVYGALTTNNISVDISPEYLATLGNGFPNVQKWVRERARDRLIKVNDSKEKIIRESITGLEGKKQAEYSFSAEERALGDFQRARYADRVKDILRESLFKQAEAVALIDSIGTVIENVQKVDQTAGATLKAKETEAKKKVEDGLVAGKGPTVSFQDGVTFLQSQLVNPTPTILAALQLGKETAQASLADTAKNVLDKAGQVAEVAATMKKIAGAVTPAKALGTAFNAVASQIIGPIASAIADSEDAKCPQGYYQGGSITSNNPYWNKSKELLGDALPVDFFSFVNAGLDGATCMRVEPDGTVKTAMRGRCGPRLQPNSFGERYYCYGAIPEFIAIGTRQPYIRITENKFLPNCFKPFTLEGLCESAAQFIFEYSWDNAKPEFPTYMVITKFNRIIRMSDTLMDADFEFQIRSKTTFQTISTNFPHNRIRCTFIFEATDFDPKKKNSFKSRKTNTIVSLTQQEIVNKIAQEGRCEGHLPEYFCQQGLVKGYYKTIAFGWDALIMTQGSTDIGAANLYGPSILTINYEPRTDFMSLDSQSKPRITMAQLFPPAPPPTLQITYASWVLRGEGNRQNDAKLQGELQSRVQNNQLNLTNINKSNPPNDSWKYPKGNSLEVQWQYGSTSGTVYVSENKPLTIAPPPPPPPAPTVPTEKDLRPSYWNSSAMGKEPTPSQPYGLAPGIEYVMGFQNKPSSRVLGTTFYPLIDNMASQGKKTAEQCRQMGLQNKAKYKAWGYRTIEHPNANERETCFLYKGLLPFSGKPGDKGNVTGCLEPNFFPEFGCL